MHRNLRVTRNGGQPLRLLSWSREDAGVQSCYKVQSERRRFVAQENGVRFAYSDGATVSLLLGDVEADTVSLQERLARSAYAGSLHLQLQVPDTNRLEWWFCRAQH